MTVAPQVLDSTIPANDEDYHKMMDIEYYLVLYVVFVGVNIGVLFGCQTLATCLLQSPKLALIYILTVFLVLLVFDRYWKQCITQMIKLFLCQMPLTMVTLYLLRSMLRKLLLIIDIRIAIANSWFEWVVCAVCIFVICALVISLLRLMQFNKLEQKLIFYYRFNQISWYFNLFIVPSLYLVSFLLSVNSKYAKKRQVLCQQLKQTGINIKQTGVVTVSVVICTYNEGILLKYCVDSIVECIKDLKHSNKDTENKDTSANPCQCATDINFRIVISDSYSTDKSIDLIKDSVDCVYNCDIKGKLSARHYAMMKEINDHKCDIIVCCDADRQYSKKWLLSMINPLIAATHLCTFETDWYMFSNLSVPFNGGASAFYASIYPIIPFNLNRNQFSLMSIWCEEEWLFGIRMYLLTNGKILKKEASYIERNNEHDSMLATILRGWGVTFFHQRNF